MEEEMKVQENSSLENHFDGTQFGPQITVALKQFLLKNPSARVASGVALNIPGSSTNYPIAHGLGATPTFVSVSGFAVGGALGFVIPYLSQTNGGTAPNATNIFVDTSSNAACNATWYAAII